MANRKWTDLDPETVLGIIQMSNKPIGYKLLMQKTNCISRPQLTTIINDLLRKGAIATTYSEPPEFYYLKPDSINFTLKAEVFLAPENFIERGRVDPEIVLGLLQVAGTSLTIDDIMAAGKVSRRTMVSTAIKELLKAKRIARVANRPGHFLATDTEPPRHDLKAEQFLNRSWPTSGNKTISPKIILGVFQLSPKPLSLDDVHLETKVIRSILKSVLIGMVDSKILLKLTGEDERYTILSARVKDYSQEALAFIEANKKLRTELLVMRLRSRAKSKLKIGI
ncbi:hypothetical protein [Pseudomonas sp. CFBP 13719]|uniref:hypothetical protein n=1 Tax=Pseudomonas sp. CFBP 13719 TaxID=2775303 RepID=UPI0017825160|nr:hypothetical protein [Pseudomonas sp. CFBP 13719]MBD8614928.1 hypothetical protein [Pseudomonas putida]MBD8681388.1 hypothetical protein [Pseudomonas sp. CFBP 13719]